MKGTWYRRILSVAFLLVGFSIPIKETKAETVTDFQQGENHYIPLTVASSGYYTIELSSHFGADADLYVYDANNVLVAKGVKGGSDSVEGYLDPGNYKIRIYMSMCLSDDCSAYINVRREGRKVNLFH